MNYIKISEIKINPANPRVIKDERFYKLVRSIAHFPAMLSKRGIVVDKNRMSLGGNQRKRGIEHILTMPDVDFQKLMEPRQDLIPFWDGLRQKKSIPENWVVDGSDFTEDEIRRFVIADNVSFGELDMDALANEWDAEELQEWGVDLPGDFGGGGADEAQEDDYEIPEEIETDIVLGDFFEIGPHRLLCGDSTKPETFEILFADQLADLVVTDPPYNVDYSGKTKDALKIENDSMADGEFYKFLFAFYSSLAIYTKAGGAWYVWHADSEGANFRLAMANAGIKVRQCLIWVKNSMVMGRQDYHWKHEPCLYGWKEGAAHGWYSDRKQTTVLEFDRPNRNAEHPTMKPIPLFAYQIGNSSKQGDIVADGFGGSGTTMVACHQMNRRAYIVEYDPKYCQVILDRMLKLDPTLEIKKNGQPYEVPELNKD